MMPIPNPSPHRRAAIAVATVALCATTGPAVAANSFASGASATASASASGSFTPTSTTTSPDGTYTSYSSVAYVPNGNSQQILNLYVPTNARRSLPLIIYVHGGGWGGGDLTELQANSGWETILHQGFAIASIDYTLSGTAKFPQQIYDVKAAIRYLRANAGRYGLDGQIGLWGESAGGQLVALAGATCGDSSLEGDEGVSTRVSSCVQAVVDGMGPTDFLQMDSHLYSSSSLHHDPASSPESQYLGCTDGLLACPASTVERANPITYLTSSSKVPPYLIVQGDADNAVPIYESQILFSALTSICADATFYTLHGLDHYLWFSPAALDPPYPSETVQSTKNCGSVSTSSGPTLTWDGVAAFFQAHLR